MSEDTQTKYYPISKWPHPWPPAGGFRYLIFNAKSNGFDKVIKRVNCGGSGRKRGKILIDEKAFFEWMKENSV